MDVGIRGGVYSVSNVGGTTKISRKTQTNDAAEEKEAVSAVVLIETIEISVQLGACAVM